ncbi:hypothetical protein MHLP_04350 [Candidatus Mycoplasma haematolamae str. Purdue]|uniref:Uncharacterized protein n=1 Tax=Mycoplasma haematolamae (strain Purdue) TaxID=1212765 RepID=I7BAY5_MYCHA|nr:hypothetical protein [Candidatus Mycoplasma haematolamae]AFO52450.1 hypothetical protein MHLP_04350 [Candidatus Mycoplasma haematolamae str. Purdue]
MAISFPGIVAAAATLTAGITTNVIIVSAYQTIGTNLDLSNIPDDIITGDFDKTDKVKVRQREEYLGWKHAVLWYLYTANCNDPNKVDSKNEVHCKKHQEKYKTAPEVKNPNAKMEDLKAYYDSLTKRAEQLKK